MYEFNLDLITEIIKSAFPNLNLTLKATPQELIWVDKKKEIFFIYSYKTEFNINIKKLSIINITIDLNGNYHIISPIDFENKLREKVDLVNHILSFDKSQINDRNQA